jgi:hypothetical protein
MENTQSIQSTQTTQSQVNIAFDSRIKLVKAYLQSKEIRDEIGDLHKLREYCFTKKLDEYKNIGEKYALATTILETNILNFIRSGQIEHHELLQSIYVNQEYLFLLSELVVIDIFKRHFTQGYTGVNVVMMVLKHYGEYNMKIHTDMITISPQIFEVWKYIVDNNMLKIEPKQLSTVFFNSTRSAKSLVYLFDHCKSSNNMEFVKPLYDTMLQRIYVSNSSHYMAAFTEIKDRELLVKYIDHFYDITKPDKSGTTLEDLASKLKIVEVTKYLTEKGVIKTSIPETPQVNVPETASIPTQVSENLTNLIKFYASRGDMAMVKILAQKLD